MPAFQTIKKNIGSNLLYKRYKDVITLGLISKALILLSSYISIILLNKILGKTLYGEFVFFQSIFGYLVVISLLGFDKTIIYKLSGYKKKHGELIGKSLLKKTILFSTGAILIAELLFTAAWASTPKTAFLHDYFWITIFCFNSCLITCNTLYESYFQANKLASAPIRASNYINICRLAMLALMYSIDSTDYTDMAIYIIGPSLLHFLWFYKQLKTSQTSSEEVTLKASDYSYSFKMMFTKFAYVGIERIDIIMIGVMLLATDVAEYAVAAKIAIVVSLGNDLLSPLLSPRLKYQIESGTETGLKREYQSSRTFSSSIALICLALICLFGKAVLSMFGSYEHVQTLACILGLAFYNQIAFGPNGRYLALAGHSNFTLVSCVLLLLFMAGFNLIFINIYGQLGAAFATLISLLLLNVVFEMYIRRYLKINFLSYKNYLSIAGVNALTLAYTALYL